MRPKTNDTGSPQTPGQSAPISINISTLSMNSAKKPPKSPATSQGSRPRTAQAAPASAAISANCRARQASGTSAARRPLAARAARSARLKPSSVASTA